MTSATRLLATDQAAMVGYAGSTLSLRESLGFGVEAAEDDFWGGIGRLLAAIDLALPEASEYHQAKVASVRSTFTKVHAERLGLTSSPEGGAPSPTILLEAEPPSGDPSPEQEGPAHG